MRNTRMENIQEHSLQVATIAHSLAIIKNRFFDGNVNAERIMALAVYHEASEVITGDLATPIKYFNPEIKRAYKEIEGIASQRLLGMLPTELKEDYQSLLCPNEGEQELWRMVKAADKISAYLKCVEEMKAGNHEFSMAMKSVERDIRGIGSPEVEYFMKNFVPSFSLTLDELN